MQMWYMGVGGNNKNIKIIIYIYNFNV